MDELVCFFELTGVEKIGVVGAVILGAILIVLFLVLVFRRDGSWKEPRTGIGYKEYKVELPIPMACLVLGVALFVIPGWWLLRTFPSEAISFYGRPWTLAEIKVRVEADAPKIRIELKDEAKSFKIDRRVSGACASDLLNTICSAYSSQLECERPERRAFIIGLKRPSPAQ